MRPMTMLLCLLTAVSATAQRATEIYIPIGRSPGVSGKCTALGTCTSVDAKERVATVRAGQGTWTGRVTATTRIYLDRSALGQPNSYGTFDDLRDDRQVEIKYRGQHESGGECEWIKVKITAAGAPPRSGRSGR